MVLTTNGFFREHLFVLYIISAHINRDWPVFVALLLVKYLYFMLFRAREVLVAKPLQEIFERMYLHNVVTANHKTT